MRTRLTLLTLLLLIVCSCTQQQRPPNIIWIAAEDISAAWGAYGVPEAYTPNLDELAAEGILYRNAFANAPICAPARSTLITGMYAPSLGTEHLRSVVPRTPGIDTVPEHLKRAGYYVTSGSKTDFNFSPDGIFDLRENSDAPWRGAAEGQLFFSIINFGGTHEGPSNRPEAYDRVVADLPEELLHAPEEVTVPPYYPDTQEFRRQWARVHDLITVFDRKVAEIKENLRADGLLEDTVILVFGDHGFGMPRYKRWMTDSGMRVPLIAYVPEKYQHLAPNAPGTENSDLVSFVDFGPTTLRLAGVDIPDNMQGQPFLGENLPAPPDYVFGYRGRADDMYEVSRVIHTGSYIYIRHFMPYLAYIQPGRIFGDGKTSFKELRRLHLAGELPAESEKMWGPKPTEELYNLTTDPNELTNLASEPDQADRIAAFREQLHVELVEIRDVGISFEPEMMIRSEGSSPYEMAQDPEQYDIEAVINAAELVGMADIETILPNLEDEDSIVRFWAVQALLNLGTEGASARPQLRTALADQAPSVAIAAAHALCSMGGCPTALPTLEKWLADERPTTALYAARTILLVGKDACPILPAMQKAIAVRADPDANSGYIDFNYHAFTGWALEEAVIGCGVELKPNFLG